MHLISWIARRAGGRITVVGKDKETGADAKIVGVDRIYPTADSGKSGYLWAKDKDDVMHKLGLGA